MVLLPQHWQLRVVRVLGRRSRVLVPAQLFEAVGHLVHARERLTSKPERHHVASLLLTAARRSAASTSNAEAIDFASAGLDFINGQEGASVLVLCGIGWTRGIGAYPDGSHRCRPLP